jgi:glycosyltransferase involved in cell wall biosynthesis
MGDGLKQRIALFFPSLGAGGVQRFMLTLGAGLLARGFGVDFVLVNAAGPFLSQVPPDIRLVDLKSAGAAAALPALMRYLKADRPAAMIAAQTHVNVIAVLARRLAGAPTRLVVSERSHLSSAAANSSLWGDRLSPLLTRLFYRGADAVVAVSHNTADDLARRSRLARRQIKVVYNPCDVAAIAARASEPVEHAWFYAGEAPVFLAVGRLEKPKDYPTLLHAFAMLRAKMKARLVILGEGSLRPGLARLAHELGITSDVSLPGYSANPYAYMARAAVYVLSSAWEGFPNVLVEALACQAQVVATDCPGGPFEILDGGRYGRLAPVGNAHALAAAMSEALAAPFPPEQLLARAGQFTIEKTAAGYLEAAGLAQEGSA